MAKLKVKKREVTRYNLEINEDEAVVIAALTGRLISSYPGSKYDDAASSIYHALTVKGIDSHRLYNSINFANGGIKFTV